MPYSYRGLDCLKDADSDLYAEYGDQSQEGKNAWMYQSNYAYYVLYYGATLLFLVSVKKMWYMFSDWSERSHSQPGLVRRTGLKLSALSRIVGYQRLPVLFSRITGLPASFGTLFVLSISTVFLLAACFGPKIWIRSCGGFGSPPLAVRAGLQTMALTPFLMVVSGKTNFISFITGVSYEKVNVFHQAMGWGSLFLSMVHTVPFLIQPMREGGTAQLRFKWNDDILYRNGVPPLVCLGLLCLLSTRFSRALCYEVWFHSHWVLGLAYISLLTWHVYGLLEAEQYIWGTLGFWGFQMLYRAWVKTTFKPNAYAFKAKKAHLQRLAGDVMEISVNIESKYELDWSPGQHVFIRFIYGIHTLDNHPFSILSMPATKNGRGDLKLIVKPHKGLTKKLYDMIDDKASSKELHCFLDGPYGGMTRDPLSFDKLVLCSTGTGITVTLPFLSYVAKHLDDLSNKVKKVDLIWIVKSEASMDWIQEELIHALEISKESKGVFDIKIFVTNSHDGVAETIESPPMSGGKAESEDCITEEKQWWEGNGVQVIYNHRPLMREYLQNTTFGSKTAVICSGTSSFQGDCANACASVQKKVLRGEVEEVYLHTENFGW